MRLEDIKVGGWLGAGPHEYRVLSEPRQPTSADLVALEEWARAVDSDDQVEFGAHATHDAVVTVWRYGQEAVAIVPGRWSFRQP